MIKRIVTAVLALGLAAGVTVPKLIKMARISGHLPGAEVRTEVIADRWHSVERAPYGDQDVYWVSWGERDIRSVGPHRVNLEKERWERTPAGGTIEVVTIPGEDRPYLRDGIFVSPGNFAFDAVLLALEIGVAGWSIGWIIRHR